MSDLRSSLVIASPSYTVGIETSGPIGSVALLRDGELVVERLLGETGRRHARTLVAELRTLLAEAGLGPKDVSLVAVSIGPGSFTGLRVGVVCAKTWAYAAGSRLVAVETFTAVMNRLPAGIDFRQADLDDGTSPSGGLHPPLAGRCAWVIDDALRGDVFVQRFELSETAAVGWMVAGAVRLLPFDAWIQETAPGDVVFGPGANRWRNPLEVRGLCVAAEDFHRPTAADVARCGTTLAEQGRFADPFALVPMYIRRSAAEEKLDSAANSGSPS